jgi:uncharacterized repeat protein (TIGR03803 family)
MSHTHSSVNGIGRKWTQLITLSLLGLLVIATQPAQAQTETVLHSFSANQDGCLPWAGPTIDAKGYLYGTTQGCGPSGGAGAIYRMTRGSGKEKILFGFGGGPGGATLEGGVVFDSAGNMYGTTCCGGAYNFGTVFKLSPLPKGKWQETVLYAFQGGADGYGPGTGKLAIDGQGNLYGTAAGGDTQCDPPGGCGMVFKVAPDGTKTVLHSFSGGLDGQTIYGGVVLDGQGNVYGTTTIGGGSGCGTVFKITSAGSKTTLYNFLCAPDAAYPQAGLTLDANGNLYGTTSLGGSLNMGAVFEVTQAGTEKVLYSFTGPDGNYPYAGVTLDKHGNIYGTTYWGGSYGCPIGGVDNGCGTVFKITPAGLESVLYRFTVAPDGEHPVAPVALDKKGNIYGTTYFGGSDSVDCGGGCGTVFKVVP